MSKKSLPTLYRLSSERLHNPLSDTVSASLVIYQEQLKVLKEVGRAYIKYMYETEQSSELISKIKII